jgi:ribosomal protein S18 acetylase RimI-like enzyme
MREILMTVFQFTIKNFKEIKILEPNAIEDGFFEDWPNPPPKETHFNIMRYSSACFVAMNNEGKIVGFVTAISDGFLSAYIPLLEVLPKYRGAGIATKLIEAIKNKLQNLYMLDLSCDENLIPFYERFGFKRGVSMNHRNYKRQSAEEIY